MYRYIKYIRFFALVILAYHPKIVTVLIFERFEGFSLLRWLVFGER